jgi:hypothetical protein
MSKTSVLLAAAVLSTPLLADAAILDLTAGGSGTINGAIFQTTDQQPTGTGVIDPFLRLQHNTTEQGYNTSGSPLPFDEKAGIWTHDLRLADTRAVIVLGQLYAAFILDINEATGGDNNLLSLNAVQIYTSPTPSQTTTNVSSLGVLRYNLDSSTDYTVELDYSLNNGSGSGDMLMYVPASAFSGASSSDYLYLYCEFGNPHTSDAGFEEWANIGNDPVVVVPAPGPVALLGLGTLLAVGRKRR